MEQGDEPGSLRRCVTQGEAGIGTFLLGPDIAGMKTLLRAAEIATNATQDTALYHARRPQQARAAYIVVWPAWLGFAGWSVGADRHSQLAVAGVHLVSGIIGTAYEPGAWMCLRHAKTSARALAAVLTVPACIAATETIAVLACVSARDAARATSTGATATSRNGAAVSADFSARRSARAHRSPTRCCAPTSSGAKDSPARDRSSRAATSPANATACPHTTHPGIGAADAATPQACVCSADTAARP